MHVGLIEVIVTTLESVGSSNTIRQDGRIESEYKGTDTDGTDTYDDDDDDEFTV